MLDRVIRKLRPQGPLEPLGFVDEISGRIRHDLNRFLLKIVINTIPAFDASVFQQTTLFRRQKMRRVEHARHWTPKRMFVTDHQHVTLNGTDIDSRNTRPKSRPFILRVEIITVIASPAFRAGLSPKAMVIPNPGLFFSFFVWIEWLFF